MNRSNFRFTNWRRGLALAAALTLAAASAAFGQAQTGNLYGSVTDTEGSPLPGVTVEVSGIGAPRLQITDANGQFRFLSLDPGNYQLTASLEGFSTVEHPAVNIRVGRSTTLEVELSSAVEAVITVTSESPLLDERKIQAGTTVSQIELEKIPTARDPWATVTQTPGVLSDRINVGGNESGQQAVFTGLGVSDDENAFAVDGVVVTDMTAIGASPTYYDFDQFEEFQITTGGADVTTTVSGVTLNLVTKRGSNQPRGSARYYLTDSQELFGLFEQADPQIEGDLAPGQASLAGNRINEVVDSGFEAGGPIARDKLWIWASYGRNDIKQFAATGDADNTLLENSALKLNAQLSAPNSLVASWNRGDKIKLGRDAGPDRRPETTFDQSGPTEIWKLEDTQVFSSSFYLTGLYSYVDGGFQLLPKALTNAPSGTTQRDLPEALWDSDGVWKNGFIAGGDDRNSELWQIDGSYFFNTGDTSHELKFGTQYRQYEVSSNFSHSAGFGWPGRSIVNVAGENFGVAPGPTDFFFAVRGGTPNQVQDYTSVWVQDTLTRGDFTVNAGLRYDLQEGRNEANRMDPHPGLPDLMPGLDFAGNDGGGFEWADVQPRVGVTYALGPERKTLLRASFARFAEQLSTADLARLDPTFLAYGYFVFTDQNGDNIWQESEPASYLFGSNFDPNDPVGVPNLTDRGLDAPTTDEVTAGVEHAVLPELVVGLSATYRLTSDVLDGTTLGERQLIRDAAGNVRVATRDDYVPDEVLSGTLPDGRPYAVPTFALRPDLEFTGGTLLANGDREIEYLGFGLNFTKRLSHRWMARGYFQWGEGEWKVPGSYLRTNDPNDLEEPANNTSGDRDGELFAVESDGSGNKGDVWLQASWSANLNGMYQVAPDRPWGFNLAANLFWREGYPLPYFESFTGADGLNRNIQVVSDVDSFRADDIFTTDLRIEKEVPFSSNLSGTLSLDAFNVFNENYVLQRERNLSGSRPDFLDETLSPRIYRLGFRINWR